MRKEDPMLHTAPSAARSTDVLKEHKFSVAEFMDPVFSVRVAT